MKQATFRVIIEPDKGGYHGYVPALRGCHSWGKTVAQTQKHLQEAIELFIESLAAHGDPIPMDVGFESFQTVTLPKTEAVRPRVATRQYA